MAQSEMQCASSTTSMPIRAISVGICSSRNFGLFRRSGETRSTSTSSRASAAWVSPHSCAFAELIDTARTPARAAAATWSRIRASSGDTRTVGPPPRRRSRRVARKYTADLPHPVRCTTRARCRCSTRAEIASSWPGWNTASGRPVSAASACCASAAMSADGTTEDDGAEPTPRPDMPPCCQHRPTKPDPRLQSVDYWYVTRAGVGVTSDMVCDGVSIGVSSS